MVYLLSGLAVLTVVLMVLRGFTSANPAVIARQLRFVGGALLMAVAAGLALRGRIDLALLIGFAGWGLLMGRGVLPWGSGGWGSGGSGGAGQGSRVSTDHLEMELDHASGTIRGTSDARHEREREHHWDEETRWATARLSSDKTTPAAGSLGPYEERPFLL